MRLLREYNKKYLGYAKYDPLTASLGESFYARYLSLSAVGNDARANDVPSTTRPMPRTLLRSTFGRPSPNHSFHQQACFETAFVAILKLGFFEPTNVLALHDCHPLLSHLISTCVHLRHHDFSWLAEYDTAWSTQDTLRDDKAYAFLACLIHYDLSIANTIRFLGNNYTGEYRDIPSTVASLRACDIAESLLEYYSRVMTVGCPNHFNATTTPDNALLYWLRGKHPSIRAKL